VIRENPQEVIVEGKNFTIRIGNRAGNGLSSYTYNGKEQIARPFLPHFKRPLTDNDRRGWKPQRKMKQWYEYEFKPLGISVKEQKNGLVEISTGFSLIQDSAIVRVIYTINRQGIIKVDYRLDANPGLPHLPKVGMQGAILDQYRNIEWFGLGPLENYVDRRYGFDAGIYKMDISEFMEPYVVPQENANRTDCRWMFLSNPVSRQGLLIVADSLLSMSAWLYTEENILAARHTNKLREAGFVTLNIDLLQMGVGGNDSWSDVAAPLEQYQIKAKNYKYSFYLVPFNSKKKSAGEKAKEIK
jgi:beta-galactosidase